MQDLVDLSFHLNYLYKCHFLSTQVMDTLDFILSILSKLPCSLLNQTTGIVSCSSSPNENTENGVSVYRAQADTEESGLGLFSDLLHFYRSLVLQEEIRSHESKVVR